jgi:hypothetical protein
MIMPWLIGQRCRALIYTGDAFDSADAFRLGLVDKVFPKATLHAEVTKVAKRMSRVSMDCLKWNKRSVNQAFETMGLRKTTPEAHVEATIPQSGYVMGAGFGIVWMMNLATNKLIRIHPDDNSVTEIPILGTVGPFANAGFGSGRRGRLGTRSRSLDNLQDRSEDKPGGQGNTR